VATIAAASPVGPPATTILAGVTAAAAAPLGVIAAPADASPVYHDTSHYENQPYWDDPGPVSWGVYEDCSGCGAYEHIYDAPGHWVDNNVWVTSGYTTYSPDNVQRPQLSGQAREKATLSATDGEWTTDAANNDPTNTYTYRWQMCTNSGTGCADIPDATAATYTIPSGSAGQTFRVVVRASNASGGNEATSLISAVVTQALEVTAPPQLTGTAKVGQTLTATNGTWTGASGATFTYQWERNSGGLWLSIPSATSSSYTLTADDLTFTVRVKVTATVGGSSQSAYPTASGAVAEADRGGSGGTNPGGGGGGGGGGDKPKPTEDPTPPLPHGEDPTPAPPAGSPEPPRGAANGTPATRDATVTATFASNGKRAIAAKYATGLRVRGTVKTAKGAPIANATVVLRARNTVPGAKPGKVATTKTDSKGRYETTIARGPSRRITVSYTAFGGDADPADSATVTVKVAAAAKLVTNVRTVRVGQALKLTGRLVHPQAGVMVLMCATDAGKWRSFDHVRTDRKGRFHYTYKFKPGSEGRSFGFSVLVDDRVYPFLAGYSNKVTVQVAR
jgi:5-hydroxyisourate hydrolase-like protein (transthyretin family)